MDKIEKIRQKIEELYDGEAPKHDQQCDFSDGYFTGISVISNFLDTLSEEPDKSLEEATHKHLIDVFAASGHISWDWEMSDVKDAFIAGAKWQAEQDDKERCNELAATYQLGRKDMKEQMMKEAVEGTVKEDAGGYPYVDLDTPLFKRGDKVKLYVFPKEEGE